MNKIYVTCIIGFITWCAAAQALEAEGGIEKWYGIVHQLQNYQREENMKSMTQPSDAINNALDNFWEQEHGSDDTTKQEKLL